MKTENPLASDQPLTIEQVFQQVDADNSGRIEFQELAEWWSAHQKQSRGSTDEQALMRCMDLFEQYDPKGKGLGEHEFRELMAELARGDWKQVMDPATNRQYWAHPTSGKSLWVAPNVEDFLREQGIVDMSGGGGLDYADAEGDTSDEVYMRLNLWKIYLKMERQARSNHYNDGFTYIVYVILLTVVVLGNMPLSTSFLMHQEGLADLLLDEEFGTVDNHKKSWYDVMTTEELFEWVEGPLHDAFHGDSPTEAAFVDGPEVQPGPLLFANKLVGRVQLRQVRVRPNKCPNTQWAESTDQNSQRDATCTAEFFPEREARFTRKPERLGKDLQCKNDWTREESLWAGTNAEFSDPSCLWWAPDREEVGGEPDEWDEAATWYEDGAEATELEQWGRSWMVEPNEGLKTSSALVRSFMGYTKVGDYGDYGYAVTLPRRQSDWAEEVRRVKGEFVCVLNDANRTIFGLYNDEDTLAERFPSDGCYGADDCPLSRAACESVSDDWPDDLANKYSDSLVDGENATVWEQRMPFIDEYTRIFAVTFNLYNGNDFDSDDYIPAAKDHDDTDHMDDHLIICQMSFAMGPSGHMEKYERISIIRPMRRFGYLDAAGMQLAAALLAFMAVTLFLMEIKHIIRTGPHSYFISGEGAGWNCFELVFFIMFVMLISRTAAFFAESLKMEQGLKELYDMGRIDEVYHDILGLKSSFRAMMRSISFLVFMSIFKMFKYMNLSDSLNFMFKIAARATAEIAGFMVVYTLLLLSCAFLATTLFGYEMREFHNLASAMTSLMRLSVGILDFDYNLMKTADAFWAPLFIIFFVFICMLIAVNMFISILSEYYDQVKTEQRQWKDDIKIFELQGMNVPSTSVVGNVHRLWSMLRLKFVLQVEVNPPHLPVEFLPTKKVVGPTWGDGYLYKAAKKGAPPLCDGTDGGPICYPNIFDNASNLVRLHYYSEFVPVELEHMRGKTRANIPILGQVSDSRGFHSHCVGLGNSTSPINELIAEYGKLWDQEIWECSTRECGHIYDPTMDGKSMSIEELFEKEELTWRCPKCKMNKPNEEWSDDQKRTTFPHVDMKFTYRRRPATNERGLQQATVTCLKTHADDMHSEVRPQVLSKMRPRFKTIVNPDDPDDMDIDFVNQCQDGPPDCIDLMEDEFGAKIRLELLVHETMAEDVLSSGKLIGRAKDMFALFRVVEISSWEHFSAEPTKLNTAQGMWKKKDDRKLFDIHTGRAKGGSLTNSQMAETFNKTEREVMLRRRFLQRCHRDDSGYPETPKLLRVALRPSFGIAMSMWWRAWWKDPEMKVVSCGYILGQLKKNCLRCKRYSDPHIGDMKKFIRRKLQHIKESTDTSDLAGMEECFLQQTMDMDEAVGMMKVNLVNSGMRSPKEMLKHYGKVGTKKMVPVKEVGADGKTVEVQLSVEEKIRRWMMWKYADEIDCVIVKTEEEEDDDEEELDGPHFGAEEDVETRRLETMKARRMSMRAARADDA